MKYGGNNTERVFYGENRSIFLYSCNNFMVDCVITVALCTYKHDTALVSRVYSNDVQVLRGFYLLI